MHREHLREEVADLGAAQGVKAERGRVPPHVFGAAASGSVGQCEPAEHVLGDKIEQSLALLELAGALAAESSKKSA